VLAVAAKKFAVETDEREAKILEVLPGANCGGCGYPGCAGYAAAIVKGEAKPNCCAAGGAAGAAKIGAIMGVEAGRPRGASPWSSARVYRPREKKI
jgi:electron transport complex protein RnfB